MKKNTTSFVAVLFLFIGNQAYAQNGKVGINTTTPGNTLEIKHGTAGNSGLRFTNLTSTTTPIENPSIGVLALNADGDVIYVNDAVQGIPINKLLAATTTNTIENNNFAQAWNWSSASTQTPLSLSGNALTTGNLLYLEGTNTLTSGSLLNLTGKVTTATTNGLLNIKNTEASNTGKVITIQVNNTAGSGLNVYANGNVGINTNNPLFTTPTNTGANVPTFGVDGTVNASNYIAPVQTITGAAPTWDLSKGPTGKWALQAGANTLKISNVKTGMYGVIILTNQGTSTLTLPTGSKVINGGLGAPNLTQTAGAVDILSFLYDGINFWWTIGNNYN